MNIIEKGWQELRDSTFPNGAPQEQLKQHRAFFFAGSQYLFTTLLKIVDPRNEITPKDVSIMKSLEEEFDKFIQNFTLEMRTMGNA